MILTTYATNVLTYNTYCDLTDLALCKEYIIYDFEEFYDLDDVLISKYLLHATRSVDELGYFIGEQLNNSQNLEFPRTDMLDIPLDIKITCVILANNLFMNGDNIGDELFKREKIGRTLDIERYGDSRLIGGQEKHSTYIKPYLKLNDFMLCRA